jgi:ribosomal protein S18 acetylase RimI-like enzyme/L-amino acid N-acyltransferase YncA
VHGKLLDATLAKKPPKKSLRILSSTCCESHGDLVRKPETSEGITIRRARGNDFSRVFQLISEAFPNEINLVGFDPKRLKRLARLYSILSVFFPILDFLNINFETILVALAEGQVVGELHLVPHGKGIWSLDSSAVDKKFRGRGIYRKLMQESLRYISQRRGERIVTSLWTTNVPAVKITSELRFDIIEEQTLLNLLETNKTSFERKENIEIRELKKSDLTHIFSICKTLDTKRTEMLKVGPKDFMRTSVMDLRNKISGIHSNQWVLEVRGRILGYAKVTYTSPKEAGSIESFYVVSHIEHAELPGYLLNYVLSFLASKGVRRVVANVNKEWKETLNAFECSGFMPVASVYEMVRWLS